MPKLAEVNIEEAAFMGKLKDHLTQRSKASHVLYLDIHEIQLLTSI